MALDVLKHVKNRFGHLFEDVCGLIIRPVRAEYSITDLGPALFRLDESATEKFERTDLTLLNMRGMTIQCSWYRPHRSDVARPCVVYLHGNCGSRWDGLELLGLLREGFTLFTYDACGSGRSDGDYVSLGFYERQDLAAVVEYLHTQASVQSIGLWGRSMGAVTSIMYASKDPSIACLVADSPFADLRQLCRDLVEQHGSWVPRNVVKVVVSKIRKKIMKLAGFDIHDLNTLSYARRAVVPAFMFHGEDDDFVTPKHSIQLSDVYGGNCLHRVVKGDHNSRRGPDVMDTAIAFLRLYLVDKVVARRAGPQQSPSPSTQPQQQPTAAAVSSSDGRRSDEDDEEEEVDEGDDDLEEVAKAIVEEEERERNGAKGK